MQIKVLVVDGHPFMRLGLQQYLVKAEGVWVVGESGDGGEAFDIARETSPDVVLLGLNLVKEPDGVALCKLLKSLPSPPRVLVHTAYNLVDDGADGFIHKSIDRKQPLDSVRHTACGNRVWLPAERAGEPECFRSVCAILIEENLTPREREVLVLILCRYSNTEIAEALNISTQTTKNHASKVLRKSRARNRKELLSKIPPISTP